MTAIQLVFDNGIESPLFDAKNPRATGLTSVQIQDRPVKRIKSHVWNNTHQNKLEFEFELGGWFTKGESQVIFDKGCTAS